MRLTGFIGPSYVARSVNFDCQRCINLYPELNEIGTGKEREVACLVSTPGLATFVNLGDGPTRGSYVASNGRAFVASGDKLFEIFADGTSLEIGSLLTELGHVSISDNGIHLFVVDGVNGYTVQFSDNAFAVVADPNWKGANQVSYLGGFFIFDRPNSDEFYLSELDSTTISTVSRASEANADPIAGHITNTQEVWMFNDRTTEIYFLAGTDNVLERVEGAFLEVGCAARFSIAKISQSIFWLGKDESGHGVVFRSQGFQPQRISTHAVEIAIQGYANIADAIAFTYQEDGHYFYVLNFPTANTTWVFDTSTNLWHERVFTNQGQFERHRANSHIFAFGKHLVCDYANGKVYHLSRSKFTDDGNAITRRRIAPHITSELKRVFYSSFQLDMETGVGLDGIQLGTDPQVMLRFSNDGGHSWSSENWKSAGKIGQTKRRAKWNRLGSARDRVFEITITDPVKIVLLGAEIQTEVGAS